MILRILRGQTAHADLGRLLDAIEIDIEAWSAAAAGPISAQPAYRGDGDDVEFLLVSTWFDAESVLRHGGAMQSPRGRLAETQALRNARAQHYELMLGMSREDPTPCEVIRVSSMALVPRRASAFYEHVRNLWNGLVNDAGLVALSAGRRVSADGEQAVVVSCWESTPVLQAATGAGFVGGADMTRFYDSDPVIEHFTALPLAPR